MPRQFDLFNALLLLPIIFVLHITITEAASVFDVYRLVQFDKSGQTFGSRRAIVNHVAQAYHARPNQQEQHVKTVPSAATGRRGDFSRRIIVINIRQFSIEKLNDIDSRGAAGLLIAIPQTLDDVEEAELEKWKSLEQYLISNSWEMPIYYVIESESVSQMVSALEEDLSDSGDRYTLVVNGNEPSTLTTPTVHNFQGLHQSQPTPGQQSDSMPTIAIVANYDTFGSAPGLAFGVDQSGSGTIAVLEAARLFGRLYSDLRTHGSYNLLLLLTGGGRMNYAGSANWIKNADPRVLESLDFVLCVEAVGKGEELYLHSSNPGKNAEIQRIHNNFKQTADEMNIPFQVVHRKVNLSDTTIYWEHEQFSRKKIAGATLSSRSVSLSDLSPQLSQLGTGSVFDRRETINSTLLRRNIKYVVEVLCKQIYKFEDRYLQVTQGSLQVNDHFVDAWLQFLNSQPRVVPYMSKDAPVLLEIEKVFNQHTVEAKKTGFQLEAGTTFYQVSSAGTTHVSTQISSFKVKPFTFDVFLALAIVLYLAAFHIYLKAPAKLEDWRNIFASKPTSSKNDERKKKKGTN